MSITAHLNACPICGYPIAPPGISWGYAGPTCPGHSFQPYPITQQPLTEADVRRIIREELERLRVVKDCSNDR